MLGVARPNADVMWWFMDRREHHRVQLRLPARLRWTTPFGQKTEVCETLNASRQGILVPCQEPHAAGVSLWVAFPYDAALPYGQPEMLARVVRSADASEASSQHGPAAALRFLATSHRSSNGNGHHREFERRASPRCQLAWPIHVRPGNIPWFEEAMTADVSADGMSFLTSREYERGLQLFISFEPTALVPWPAGNEFCSVVVRVERVAQSPSLTVAIRRLH
jgi:hypothetical protein